MEHSPPSSPGTPRTYSPVPSDEELPQPASPAPNATYTATSGEERETRRDSQRENDLDAVAAGAQLPSSDTTNKLPKGKEKARMSPMGLLDLPVDVLKEIIHQVR
jgi:hypothetical protein